MPRKPLSREKRVLQQEKPLGITFSELREEIDAADGNLRREVPMKGKFNVRLIIRCRTHLPQAWGMSLLLDNVVIDCVHFHKTAYTNTEGAKLVGWHRDLLDGGVNVGRETLVGFAPTGLDDFILRVLKMFKITLKPGRENADGQLQID